MDRLDEIDLALNNEHDKWAARLLGEEACELAREYRTKLDSLERLARQVTDSWFSEDQPASLRDFTNAIGALRRWQR